SAAGLVIILNDSVEILNPRTIAYRVGQTLSKRTADGAPRYPEIAAVWIISDAHRVQVSANLQGMPAVMMESPLAPAKHVIDFLQQLQEPWAKFEGMPLVLLPESGFASMSFGEAKEAPND